MASPERSQRAKLIAAICWREPRMRIFALATLLVMASISGANAWWSYAQWGLSESALLSASTARAIPPRPPPPGSPVPHGRQAIAGSARANHRLAPLLLVMSLRPHASRGASAVRKCLSQHLEDHGRGPAEHEHTAHRRRRPKQPPPRDGNDIAVTERG